MEKIDRTKWMYEKKYGVFLHFLHQPAAGTEVVKCVGADDIYDVSDPNNLTPWEEKINEFDVEHFAAQLNEIGAGSPFSIALNTPFTTFTLLIVQKEIKSPNGNEKISVKMNNKQVIAKPSKRLCVTVINSIIKFLYKFPL